MNENSLQMPEEIRAYMIRLKGKEYLTVVGRVLWFRMVHPKGSIQTFIHELDRQAKRCVSLSEVRDGEGNLLSSAYKEEDQTGFGDYVEKSGTGSVGRALWLAGFGTADIQDSEYDQDGSKVVDGPVSQTPPVRRQTKAPQRNGRDAGLERVNQIASMAPAASTSPKEAPLAPEEGDSLAEDSSAPVATTMDAEQVKEWIIERAREAEQDPFLMETECLEWFWRAADVVAMKDHDVETKKKWPAYKFAARVMGEIP